MKTKYLLWKRAVRAALLVLLLSTAGLTNALAQSFTVGDLHYSVNDDGVSVTVTGYEWDWGYDPGWKGTRTDQGTLIIPESVSYEGTEYSVTSIGDRAFYNEFVEAQFTGDLAIPNSVTSIGYKAFEYCSFTGNLTISNSVIEIDDRAFCGCRGFEAIIVETDNSAYDSRENCNALIETSTNKLLLGCKNTVIPNSVTSIEKGAFYECSGLISIEIPNNVSSIGYSAFAYCNNLSTVYYNAVNCADIEGLGGGGSWGGGGVQTLYPFEECSGNLVIGDNVETIPNNMFCNSGFTGNIMIPSSVISIGKGAFCNCSGFTGDLSIPNSVTSIANYAFQNCSILESLTIPSSVTTIGNGAFYGCSSFTAIYSNNATPPTLGNYAFYGVDHSIPVFVPCGSQAIYSNANGWSQFTNYYETPATITVVANPESLGWAGVVQQGTCEEPESVVEAYPYYSQFTDLLYEFINWTVDGEEVSTDPYYTFDLTEDITLVANFGPGLGNHLFVGGNSNLWSDVENWLPQELPTASSTVEILADVTMDGEVEVANVNLGRDNMVTIPPEGILTVTESLNTPFGDYFIVIEDGGQLYHPNYGIVATVKKAITPYTPGTKNGWHLIANPLYYIAYIYDIENLTSNEYDLYYYDEPSVYWINQEDANNDFYFLENGKGYLYANNQNVNLSFTGDLPNGVAEVTVPLSYSTGHALEGFNLVGNPYAHNVTSYASENVANGCFVMNEAKDDLIVSEINEDNPLKPAEGFFVKAIAEGASITFNPQRGNSNTTNGTIRVELAENNKLIDRLLVKTAEGQPLEKFSLNEQRTKLFGQGERQELAIVPCEGNEQAVNFKAAKNGQYTLTVKADNMEFNYLHLVDNLTGVDVDLLVEPSYTFEAKTSDYASRFSLRFIPKDGPSTGSGTFAFISNGNIIITGADADATLQIIDVTGRVVVSTDVARNVSTSGMPAGVYVLRLINGDDVKTQKIVVK